MTARLYQALALAAIALTLAAGYFYGPMPAAVTAGAFMALCLMRIVLEVLGRSSEPRVFVEEAVPVGQVTSWRNLFWLAVGIRCVLALLINITHAGDSLAPDHLGYSGWGQMIAESWTTEHVDPELEYFRHTFYVYLNAVFWWVTRVNSDIPVSLINAFVGTAAAWLTGRVALDIYGPAAGRRAFALAAFFPSLVLWSSMNIRDCWSWLFLVSLIWAGQRLRARFDLRSALMLAAAAVGLASVRSYLLPLVVGAFAFSFLAVRFRQIPSTLATVVLLALLLVPLAQKFGISPGGYNVTDSSGFSLREARLIREGLVGGNSAFVIEEDISTPTGAVRYLPLGMARFLLSPFPWSASSWRQRIAIPETLLWYFLLYGAIRVMARDLRVMAGRIALPATICVLLTMAYGLVEGNEGTAYRHRAQVMILLFIFSARYATQKAKRTIYAPSLSDGIPAGSEA